MATLYEYYNTGDDSGVGVWASFWRAQTFTPDTVHTITSVKILVYRTNSPNDVTVSIRATDGSGHPTGSDLGDVGTFDGNALTSSSPGEWKEITLGNFELSASTKYAIVCRVVTGSSAHKITWRQDWSSPTYAGGELLSSGNSGTDWSSSPNNEFLFEEWGEPPVTFISTVTII